MYKLLLSSFLLALSFTQSLYANDKNPENVVTTDLFWFDGDRRVPTRLLNNRVAILLDPANSVSASSVLIPENASVVATSERLVLLEIANGGTSEEFFSADQTTVNIGVNVGSLAAVFSASDSSIDAPLIMSGEIIVFAADGVDQLEVEELLKAQGSTFVKRAAGRQGLIFSCPPGPECLELANNVYDSSLVKYSYPNWFVFTETHISVNDPVYPFQWHLENTGQSGGTPGEDVEIQAAWDLGYTGDGVTIGIVDDGLETNHEDLLTSTGGANPAAPHIDFLDGDSDPNPPTANDGHGTSVSGIAAADGQNNLGVIGAGYDAKVNGIRLIGGAITFNDVASAMLHNLDHPVQQNDVYNNSWGYVTNSGLFSSGPVIESAFEVGTTDGRSGAGAIYVFSAGNSGGSGDNANYTTITNSRYTIAVAASNHDGGQSFYSEPGANVLVNAPSSGQVSGTVTTDLTGSGGFNNPPPGASNNYTSVFGGTSSSAPLVSGIVALMLEANPSLTWRDVQRILAFTAERNDTSDSDWIQNGAGYWVNHKHGYGRTDAGAAVATAQTWSNLGTEVSADALFTINLPVPDVGGGSVAASLPMPNLSINDTETIRVTIDSDHTWWGDLDIKLISPSGTVSQITDVHNSSGNQLEGGFPFTSVRYFGEDPSGTWELVVEDGVGGDIGEITSVNLEIFGTLDAVDQFCNGLLVTVDIGAGESPTSSNDVILGTSGDDQISAGAGDDVICAGAGDDLVNGGGGSDTIYGENGRDSIFGDGGDDFVFGGPQADVIDGGGGNDELSGDAGDDIISGRTGNDIIQGGDGVDFLSGGPEMDTLFTGLGGTVGTAFFVSGGAGPDTIYGGPDADDLRGGAGSDMIYGENGPDVITGGVGQDTLDGGGGADDIRGQNSPDIIIGGPGNDILTGGAGNDDIDGGTGANDVCAGQAGTGDVAINCESVSSVP